MKYKKFTQNYLHPPFGNKNTFKIFINLLIPQKKLMLTIILASLMLSIIGIMTSLFSKILFDEIIPFHLKKELVIYALIFSFIMIVQSLLTFLRTHVVLFLSRKIDIPLLLGYYNHIMNLPMKFFSTRKVGDILTRFQDAEQIKEIFTSLSISLILDILLASITGFVMFKVNSTLFIIIVVVIVIQAILIYIFKNPYKKINYEQMEANVFLNAQLIESIKNIDTIKSSVNEERELQKLEKRFIKTLSIEYKEGILSN